MGRSLWYSKVKVQLASQGQDNPLLALGILQLMGKLQRLRGSERQHKRKIQLRWLGKGQTWTINLRRRQM